MISCEDARWCERLLQIRERLPCGEATKRGKANHFIISEMRTQGNSDCVHTNTGDHFRAIGRIRDGLNDTGQGHRQPSDEQQRSDVIKLTDSLSPRDLEY